MTTKKHDDSADAPKTETQKHARTPMEAAGTTGGDEAADVNADQKAPLAPETHSADEIAQGLATYRVKPGNRLSHNGREYEAGQTVELTGMDAESLKDLLERADPKKK